MNQASEDQALWWAVAVTLVKIIPTGMNVQTALSVLSARNKAEAEGVAVREAMEANPEHMVHTIVTVAINHPSECSNG